MAHPLDKHKSPSSSLPSYRQLLLSWYVAFVLPGSAPIVIGPARDPSSTEASPEEVKKTLRCLFNGQETRAKVGCVTVDICRLAFEIQRSFPLLRLSVEILAGYSIH